MAAIVGCMAMSHAPQLLTPFDKWSGLPDRTEGPFSPRAAIEAELAPDRMKANAERCKKAIATLRDQLVDWAPDAILIVGDDQHENLLDDNMPPFSIFIEHEVDATRKYRYFNAETLDQVRHYKVDAALARALYDELMAAGFDPAWSRKPRFEGGLGHAFGRVLEFLLPKANIPIVPIMVNTYFPPAPSAARCVAFGKALGAALEALSETGRIVLIGSGGLSHTKIDEILDRSFITALESNDLDFMASIDNDTLMAGTSEIRNWMIIAGAAGTGGAMVDYVPCYRKANGVGCAMGFARWERRIV